MKHKLESRLPEEITIPSDMQMTSPEEKQRRTKEPLDESERGERNGLKFNIQKTNIMASGLITSWQIDGEIVTNFIWGGSKFTADGNCSHERCLLLGRKAMTNLDNILKSRNIADKGTYRQSYGFFPVVM